MDATHLIDGLRQFLRMETLEPDDEGVHAIVFDDGLDVEILLLTDKLLLVRSTVSRVPEDEDARQVFFQKHLQHNLLALRDQAATLSLDKPGGRIWLHCTVRTDQTDVHGFCDLVEDFVNTVEWWRNIEAPAAAPAVSQAMPHNLLRP